MWRGPSTRPAGRKPAGKKATPGPRAAATAAATPEPAAARKRRRIYKADLTNRIGAAVIDGVVGVIPGLVFLFWGWDEVSAILAAIYLLLKDGLPIEQLNYQSVGKRLLKMRVEMEETGATRLDFVTSIKRNVTLIPGLALWPLLIRVHFFAAVLALALPPAVELVLAIRDENGLRYGDKLAGTKVFD